MGALDNYPDPKLVLKELAIPLYDICDAVDQSVPRAIQYFDLVAKPVNRPLFPHLVRFWTRELLAGKEYEVIEEAPTCEAGGLVDVSNNGLFLLWKKYRIRILKAYMSSLPLPVSERRKQFYHQRLDGLFDGASSDDFVNLVVLWDIDAEFHLNDLTLVCPKDGDKGRVDYYWQVPIGPPFASRADEAINQGPDTDLDDIKPKKLPRRKEDSDRIE